MTAVSVVGPGQGEIVQLGPITMRILEDGNTTAHRLGISEITVAPHTDGPPQHRHAEHDEGFYVVSGTARFTVGDTSHDVPAGTLVMVPTGAPHTFANPGDEPAVLLNTFTPDFYVQYFRDLRGMIAAGDPMTPSAVGAVMSRYATVPATDYATPSEPDSPSDPEGPALSTTTTLSVASATAGNAPVEVTDRGTGRPVLLLHGGAGPQSVASFSDLFAATGDVRVLTPVHPGFGGTPRPDGLSTIGGLAELYIALLEELDLTDVTVVGNSIGGWIAAEMAVRGSTRIGRVVLVDAVGIEVPGHPVVDFFALNLAKVAELSYYDPDKYRIDPSTMPPAQQAAMAGNRAALAVYGGAEMTDPGLTARLGAVTAPTLVLWGDSDGIVDPVYGRAYAAAVPGARFHLFTATGHLPQIESPEQLLDTLWQFMRQP